MSRIQLSKSISRPVLSTSRLGQSVSSRHQLNQGPSRSWQKLGRGPSFVPVWSPANVYRIGPEAVTSVEELVKEGTSYLFAHAEPMDLLTMCFLSLGLYDESNTLVAAACFDDHPNMPSLPTDEWYSWLQTLYDIEDATVRNTVWIHYLVWDKRYTLLFLKPLLQACFESYETINQALMMVPPGIKYLEFLVEKMATRKLPVGETNQLKVFTVLKIPRSAFCCQYKIRRAVEEDNDDLVAIIPKVVREHYGDYYISELLTLHPESNREIIVAEHRATVVGVLILNSEVDYDTLNEEFELIPYNGLRKPTLDDDLKAILETSQVTATVVEEIETDTVSDFAMSNTIIEDEEVSSEELSERSDESDISLVNISSSILFGEDYEESIHEEDNMSDTSIESQYSAAILNEDYSQYLYSERRDSGTQISGKGTNKSAFSRDALPLFSGEPNAFALEVSASHPDHITCLYELFRAMFECYPERDYCVASLPPSVSHNYITKHFGRVVPRFRSTFPHELFILHKNAVCSELTVRSGTHDDKGDVANLLSTMPKGGVVMEKFKDAVDKATTPYMSFVLLTERQIVGVAILVEEFQSEFLELHYHVERWIKPDQHKLGMHGNLDSVVIAPMFQRHQRYFLRELHRQSTFTVLYYRLVANEMDRHHRTQPLLNAIGNLGPVKPKIIQTYDPDIIEEYHVPSVVTTKFPPFALYLVTARLTSMPRVEINKRIVVVGTGDTAMAFLHSLLYPDDAIRTLLVYSNVTVLSPHGILHAKQSNKNREMMFVNSGHLDRHYFESICLRTYVHIVTGAMTAIDRKEKLVCVNDDSFLPYDTLVLLCGEQFQKPQRKVGDSNRRFEYPNNVFIINTEADANNAFITLKVVLSVQTKLQQANMVVYGHHLEALCCLAALLELGIPGNKLVFIDPAPDTDILSKSEHNHIVNFFNNREVEDAVIDAIKKQGITIYQDYNFVDWKYEEAYNAVSSATFESKYKLLEQEIAALFFYHTKAVSAKTFQAITRCGLVFDGQLVIDENNRTNDPFIYAAGTLTKYSRRCHLDHMIHRYMNRAEVGYVLGTQIRKQLLPAQLVEGEKNKEIMKKPLVEHCKLPGGLHYLYVSKPGKPVPLDLAMNREDYGKVLVTGQCQKLDGQGYFRLHLNKFNAVETITCLAKFAMDIQNLISLYGKHERLLNNLVLRFEMSMITDLYNYFKEPWCYAIYQHEFQQYLDECSAIFATLRTDEGELLTENIRRYFEENEWKELNRYQLDEVEDTVKDTSYFKILEEKLLLFLQNNYVFLPMYAHPMLVRTIMHEIRNSPLFVKK